MNLQEAYEALGGNYEKVLHRLRNDVLIRSLMADFLEDREFFNLQQAMQAQDEKAAFEAAHALKGIVLNMEFGSLAAAVVPLTEALRYGKAPDTDQLFAETEKAYALTTEVIRKCI